VVVGFELRASRLLGRGSTLKPCPPLLCAVVILEMVVSLLIFPGWPGLKSSYFKLPALAGTTGTCQHLIG
jgi:hypothetical protein